MDNNTQSGELNKEKEIEQKVGEYTDAEGLSTKKLNFGLWYVQNKGFFKKLIILGLIALSAIFWSYSIYGFAHYLIRGMDDDELLIRRLTGSNIISHDYLKQVGPKDLKYFPVKILTSSKGKYDLAVRVQNINEKWFAEFDYYFLVGNQQIGRKHGFILPIEEKYLMALSQDFTAKQANARIVIENLNWRRINQHNIPNWQIYKNNHLNFLIKDSKFTPSSKIKLSDKISLNQVEFTVDNKTAFNYSQVGFQIIFFRGMEVAGVNTINLYKLMSGEERYVEIRWPGNINRVSKIEIMPELNIMEDDIYIQY